MKKILFSMAALLMLSTADAGAQGFLKGLLNKKAQQAVTTSNDDEERDESADPSNIAVAQGSDIVPKRKTVTITWDGIVTPSTASTASALMKELPALPSAEKMARSTMAERDSYTQKIAAVLARAEQLQEEATGCSDAEMEALREKWERKVQDLFGLTKEEMAILNDANAPESKKQPIQDKVMAKIMGAEGVDRAEMARFEKMSEKEQEAYIRQHPEFMQKMQKMAMNAGSFSRQAKQMTAALNGYEAKVGQLVQHLLKVMQEEDRHSYASIAKKYDSKLQKLYDQICSTDDAVQIDELYEKADKLLYSYRLEAAKEYRASLLRLIDEQKKFAAEFARLSKEVVKSGDLPECAIDRTDLNAVIMVGNLLDEAYKELPALEASPVCEEVIYELPNGWCLMSWECRGYVSGAAQISYDWPLLATRDANGVTEWGVYDKGKFRQIDEGELERINKQADQRQKLMKQSTQKPPYGTYKSRSGKRTVEYSQTGEVIINGMTSFSPITFEAKGDCLEWIVVDCNKIVKCIYKL